MFFERELYGDLVNWANKSRYALYLEGPRQVGKTELLKKLGREAFNTCVYIDLRSDSRKFEKIAEQYINEFGRSTYPEAKGLEIRRKDKVNALKWLEDCKIIGIAPIYNELERVATLSNKSLFYFRDLGIMSQLCSNSLSVLPSDINGMTAENFVYLQLLEMTGKFFVEPDVRSYKGSLGQIDFAMHDKNRRRIGIEVKHGSGATKSGDKALAAGKIDFLVKLQDTYGSLGEKQATIPIFMLDKITCV